MKLHLELRSTVERLFAVPPFTVSPGLLHHLGRISEDARNFDVGTLTCELQAPSRGLYYFRKSFFVKGDLRTLRLLYKYAI